MKLAQSCSLAILKILEQLRREDYIFVSVAHFAGGWKHKLMPAVPRILY
jgi:hypothetical protein